MVSMILSDPVHDSEMIEQATHVWQELYGNVRRSADRQPRSDKGLLKVKMEDPQGAVSEKQWLKKRRVSVSELLTTPPAKAVRKEDLGEEVWTPAHDKELLFNARKHEANLFNALRSNTVTAHEVPAAVREAAAQHFENVVRLASG
jgi:hypothetical protein